MLIHYNMGSKSAIGIGNGICFKQVRDKDGGPYIDPLVRDSIVGLWKFDQNTNESPTRNIIKNTIKDKGGDLELLNFGYKLNSGYNGYVTDFTEWRGIYSDKTQTKVTVNKDISFPIYVLSFENATSAPTFRIKVSGLPEGQTLYYRYLNEEGVVESRFNMHSDGIYTLPATAVSDTPIMVAVFATARYHINIKGLTIEQLPLYKGALVTDGKNDMIVSQKTVQEMGITDKITVVSMIHQIGIRSEYNRAFNNYIRNQNVGFIRNNIAGVGIGKTGIYGYTWDNSTKSVINNILGDKNDYSIEVGNSVSIEGKFTVEGYIKDDSQDEISGVAVYWTFIANKVLTTDEINQIIRYYKLDKYVTPQVVYDVKRQGLTNGTPDSDWYLKDFSGNGNDMTLYNFAKKLDSGIGKYKVDFNTWIPQSYVADSTYTSNKLHVTNIKGDDAILYTKKGVNAMKVKITGIQSFNLVYRYIAENDVWEALEVDRDGIYELPASTTTTKTYYTGFTVPYYTGYCDITIEQISDYEGALVSDGIDDYGNVENLPILKDYTVAIERQWITSPVDKNQCLAFKGHTNDWGAFACEFSNAGQLRSYTFSPTYNILQSYNEKSLVYQSKHSYSGTPIDANETIDGSTLRLCLPRDGFPFYANVAIKRFLLFPYTLSEFLLERQLKRYRLSTLYPDMVEFRPIINNNNQYKRIDFYTQSWDKKICPGDYVPINSILRANIYLNNELSELQSFRINGVNVTFVKSSVDKTAYNIGNIPITESPQEIDITIDEYIRFEDIIQPYPAIVNLSQDGKSITWGDKLKVGSDIVFVGSANLLPELYTVSDTRYNGVTLYPNTIIKVEKSMVFDNARTYLKANEPSCILSPNRLRIPNSSYKILRYIPDLTGKGNHGRINNSAYAEMSGANRYVYNWNTWRISKSGITSTITDSSLHITSLKGQYNPNQVLFEPNATANTGDKSNFKVNITGLTSDMKCTFNNAGSIIKELVNGVNEISVDLVAGWYGFMITSLDGSVIGDCDITIQQIGQYEGSFCLDGVDDFVTIPTLAHGAKQVLMKVNLQSYDRYLYDQRNNGSQYLAIVSTGKTIAYEYSNKGGKTYIDGILNEHIIDKDLLNITHNITAANANIEVQYAPNIGTSFARDNFAQMALFDFMLFPEISSEEEIQELNDIVGIEGGYVESPDYYWDAYGKKNTDTDRYRIADQVSKKAANALEVKNVGYNSKSGYTDDNGLLLDGVDDRAVNTIIPAVTDFTVIAKRKFPESTLVNNQTFLVKGNPINENDNVNALVMECYRSDNYVISFQHQNVIPLEESKISWATPTSYNGNVITKGSGVDSAGLAIGRLRDLYRTVVFYKLMFYTKTIDQLSINMLKNLFERDELIDITNPIFKKKEL